MTLQCAYQFKFKWFLKLFYVHLRKMLSMHPNLLKDQSLAVFFLSKSLQILLLATFIIITIIIIILFIIIVVVREDLMLA